MDDYTNIQQYIRARLAHAALRGQAGINLYPYMSLPTAGDFAEDRKNIAMDWRNVGNDLRRAIDKIIPPICRKK